MCRTLGLEQCCGCCTLSWPRLAALQEEWERTVERMAEAVPLVVKEAMAVDEGRVAWEEAEEKEGPRRCLRSAW